MSRPSMNPRFIWSVANLTARQWQRLVDKASAVLPLATPRKQSYVPVTTAKTVTTWRGLFKLRHKGSERATIGVVTVLLVPSPDIWTIAKKMVAKFWRNMEVIPTAAFIQIVGLWDQTNALGFRILLVSVYFTFGLYNMASWNIK